MRPRQMMVAMLVFFGLGLVATGGGPAGAQTAKVGVYGPSYTGGVIDGRQSRYLVLWIHLARWYRYTAKFSYRWRGPKR